ncbi:hypothetical protein MKW92_035398 [Papaver armeniacum]|nr:hypothetical protein MKW92_035398 [Papaver armeniacum]
MRHIKDWDKRHPFLSTPQILVFLVASALGNGDNSLSEQNGVMKAEYRIAVRFALRSGFLLMLSGQFWWTRTRFLSWTNWSKDFIPLPMHYLWVFGLTICRLEVGHIKGVTSCVYLL